MRMQVLFVCLFLVGCGVSVTPNAAPVDVTFHVTASGKPVNDVVFNFQPVGDGLQAEVVVVDGAFRAKVTPGSYTYFFSAGKSEANLRKISDAFRQGDMERTLEIRSSGSFDVTLD